MHIICKMQSDNMENTNENVISPLADDGQLRNIPIWGYHIVIFISALFFTISSISAKFAGKAGVGPMMITFCRFGMGLILISCYIVVTRTSLKPKRMLFMILRGVFNMLAIVLFYWSVRYTTVTNANLLNMTYPVFVALLSPILVGEHLGGRDWFILILAGIGIYLVINPDFNAVNVGDLLGLGCGIAASFAIIMLRLARKSNQTATVLFIMLLTGTLILWPAIFREDFSSYTVRTIWLLLICGISGVLGQFAITLAFKHMTAFAGSISGTSRIILAGLGGYIMLGECPGWNVAIGAIIIIAAIVLLANNRKIN